MVKRMWVFGKRKTLVPGVYQWQGLNPAKLDDVLRSADLMMRNRKQTVFSSMFSTRLNKKDSPKAQDRLVA